VAHLEGANQETLSRSTVVTQDSIWWDNTLSPHCSKHLWSSPRGSTGGLIPWICYHHASCAIVQLRAQHYAVDQPLTALAAT
jgi:hypothetical protein